MYVYVFDWVWLYIIFFSFAVLCIFQMLISGFVVKLELVRVRTVILSLFPQNVNFFLLLPVQS